MTEHEPRGPEVFTTDVDGAAVTERSPQMVETPLGKLALVRDGERIVAIDAWCPPPGWAALGGIQRGGRDRVPLAPVALLPRDGALHLGTQGGRGGSG